MAPPKQEQQQQQQQQQQQTNKIEKQSRKTTKKRRKREIICHENEILRIEAVNVIFGCSPERQSREITTHHAQLIRHVGILFSSTKLSNAKSIGMLFVFLYFVVPMGIGSLFPVESQLRKSRAIQT